MTKKNNNNLCLVIDNKTCQRKHPLETVPVIYFVKVLKIISGHFSGGLPHRVLDFQQSFRACTGGNVFVALTFNVSKYSMPPLGLRAVHSVGQ